MLLGVVFYLGVLPVRAEVAVDTTIFTTNTSGLTSSPAAVCIDDARCFVFYLDSGGGISMASTTNRGASWTGGRNVDSVNTTDAVSVGIWWEGWTPGTTTTRYIHIATTDTGVDDTYYTRYDITNNSFSTTVLATTQAGVCARSADCYPTITMVTNGTLYMATAEATDRWVVRCSVTCTTAGNWTELAAGFYDANGDDFTVMAPIPGTDNLMMVWWDITLDDILFNIYSATSSSWLHGVGATGTITTTAEDNATYDAQLMGIAIATSTGQLALAYVDDANDYTTQDHDIRFWLYATTTGWVQQSLPVTNATGGLTAAKPTYDEYNDTWYVLYGRRSTIGIATTTRVYYRTSSDGGTTWSAEQGPVSDNNDDVNALTTGITSYDRIGAWWNYTTAPRADQEFYDDVVDIIPQTISGTLYSDAGVTPITTAKTIKMAIGVGPTAVVSTSTVSGTGVYTINVPTQKTATGTPITVFVDGDAVDAVTFTKASSTANITGLDLYQNYLVVKNETLSTTTRLSDIYGTGYDSSDDSDVLFTASTTLGTFTVSATDSFLVASGTTLLLDLPAVLGSDLEIATSSTFTASSTLSVAGDLRQNGQLRATEGEWAARTPAGGNAWSSVAYGNGVFVAVSTNDLDRVMTSEDGVTWSASSASANYQWISVTFGNGLFVAVAQDGIGNSRVMTSSNGTTWTTRNGAGENTWTSVTYGNGLFVAVCSYDIDFNYCDEVMTSADGINWATSSAAGASYWYGVTYGNGLFVAVAEDGTERIMTSSNGTTWTARTAPEANAWRSVTYGNGLFVAVAPNGTSQVMTSPDGLTWTGRTAAALYGWNSVTYGNGLFVAVANDEVGHVMTSQDGVNWVLQSTAGLSGFSSVTYGNGLFVAVGFNSAMSSTGQYPLALNGSSAQTLSGGMTGVNRLPQLILSASGTKTFLATASTSVMTVASTSGNVALPTAFSVVTDLTAYATVTASTTLFVDGDITSTVNFNAANTTNLFLGGDITITNSFAAPSMLTLTGTDQTASGTRVFNNLTLIGTGTKTLNENATTSNLVINSNTNFIAPQILKVTGDYTNNGTTTYHKSLWNAGSAIEGNQWTSITYGNGRFVAVCYYDFESNPCDVVMTSTDGLTWATSSTGVAAAWNSVTYGNGRFVAVAGDSLSSWVMTSSDGISWTAQTAAGLHRWRSVTYGNGLFVAVSDDGPSRVMTSPDGVTWTAQTAAGDNDSWNSVTYGNGRFVAVATGGIDRVMTSSDGISWDVRTPASFNLWSSVTYGNGLFVAVDYDTESANQVMTSSDGITWTSQQATAANNWRSIIYGNGLFVAVAEYGTDQVMTSVDGVTWTRGVIESSIGNWTSVTYGNGLFVAVANGGVMTSPVWGTTTFSGGSTQTIAGGLTGKNSFGNVSFSGANNKIFSNNASTSAFTIEDAGTTITAPSHLTIRGSYANAGTFEAGSGTTTLAAEGEQTLSGNLSGTSAFNNLIAQNISGATTTFASALEVDGAFIATSTGMNFEFAAGATTTVGTALIVGDSAQKTKLHSTTPGSRFNFEIEGTYLITGVDVKDSNGSSTAGAIIATGVNSGNTSGWSFSVDPADILTVTGTLYGSDRTTPYATSTTVSIAVATSTVGVFSTTTATTTGAFSFVIEVGTVAPGSLLTLYADNNVAVTGATIIKKTATNTISSIPLYKDHVTLTTAGTSTTTFTAADLFTFDSSDDSDVTFTGSSTLDRLTILSDDTFYIATGTTLTLNRPTVLTGDFETATSATVLSSSTLSVAGDYKQYGQFRATEGGWTERSVPVTRDWSAITYGNGLFVAISSFGTTNRIVTSPDGITWTARTAAEANQWTSVSYGNGLFVAVCVLSFSFIPCDSLMTSPDGVTWTTRSAASAGNWRSVTYGNGLFVAVGSGGGEAMTSPDGINWTSQSAGGVSDSWYSITYGNGLFVVVGYGGGNQVMTSPDGVTWTARTAAEANDWRLVTYGNGLFVAVSSNQVMTSPDGVTWTIRAEVESRQWSSITYGNGLFVALPYDFDSTNYILSSPNGIDWVVEQTTVVVNDMAAVTYGNGLFVAAGDGGMISSYGDFGLEFSGMSSQYVLGNLVGANKFSSLIFTQSGQKYIGTIASTTDVLVSETSGTTTATSAISISGNYENNAVFIAPEIVYLDGSGKQIFNGSWNGEPDLMAVGSGEAYLNSDITVSNVIISESSKINAPERLTVLGTYTNNGSTTHQGAKWSTSSVMDNSWKSVTYGNGLFVAVCSGDAVGDPCANVMTSPDGITWTARSAAAANSWTSVTYGNGLFVAVAQSGINQVMTSPDGITWTARSAAAANSWTSVTYGNGLFVAVACGIASYLCNNTTGGSRVMTSPDGITWTARSAAEANQWTSVTYGNGLFVAVSSDGTNRVMTSPDGITWTAQTDVTGPWSSVTYGNGLFVAVSSGGINQVMTSLNGVTWTLRTSPESENWSKNWTSVTYGNGLFVAVAQNGINQVMTSPDGITWTARSAAAANSWTSVTYGNGFFVAVTDVGDTNRVITSPVWGEMILSGNTSQTIAGDLTGANSFGSIIISGNGTKIFNSAFAVGNEFVATGAGSEVRFPASATTTVSRLTLQGVPGDEVLLRSTASGTSAGLFVENEYNLNYVDVKDSQASSTLGVLNAVGIDSGNNTGWAFDVFAITLADGTMLPDTVAYPSGSATTTSIFTLRADSGESGVVTELTVDLQFDYATSALERIEITNEAGSTVYGSSTDFSTLPLTITLDTNTLTVTDATTTYLVRIVPKSHAALPVPLGSEYSVVTWVSDFAGDGGVINTSNYGRRVTVDNLSPTLNASSSDILYSEDFESGTLSGSTTSWVIEYDVPALVGGFYSAVSGIIGDNESTSYEIEQTVGELGAELYFYRKVSSEIGADYLELYINNVITASWSGEAAWSEVGPYTLSPGTSTIRFTYTKDGSGSAGSDLAIIDNIRIGRFDFPNISATSTETVSAVVSYNTPTATDYHSSIVLFATSTFSETPVEGEVYTQGETIGEAIVGCVDTVGVASTTGGCDVLNLEPGVTHYFTVFSRDRAGNYSLAASSDEFIPATTTSGGTPAMSLEADTSFYFNQATTSLGIITITEAAGSPTITAANDIRIRIATSTTNFRFDTDTTTLSFGGTAAGRVSNPVSYEAEGAVLVIPVSSNFAAGETLTVNGIEVGSFAAVSTLGSNLALYTDGVLGTVATSTTEMVRVVGLLTVEDHDVGQVENQFGFQNQTAETLFAFKLTPTGETATVTDMVLTLSGVQGLDTDEMSNFALYHDVNADAVLDGGDVLIDGAGILTINGQHGAVTFSTDFVSTTSRNFIITGDLTGVDRDDAVVLSLLPSGVTAVGAQSNYQPRVVSTVDSVQHERFGSGGGGSSSRVGEAPVAGAGEEAGGESGGGGGVGQEDDGENIASDPDYFAPTETGAIDNQWTNPNNALDSDGQYATAASNALRQSFSGFNFNIPGGNTITGISVKVDASVAAQETPDSMVTVSLSWDGGNSYTSAVATPLLGLSDLIYTLGGATDLWGRSWSSGEFSPGNFILRVTSDSPDTIRLDALEVRVYHQAGGGGSGGGGRI